MRADYLLQNRIRDTLCVKRQSDLEINRGRINNTLRTLGKPLRHEGGSGYIVTIVLNLGTRERWAVSFTFRPHYSEKNTRYLLESSLVGPQSRLRRSGEEKNSYACGKSNDISSIIKPGPAHSSDSTLPERRG